MHMGRLGQLGLALMVVALGTAAVWSEATPVLLTSDALVRGGDFGGPYPPGGCCKDTQIGYCPDAINANTGGNMGCAVDNNVDYCNMSEPWTPDSTCQMNGNTPCAIGVPGHLCDTTQEMPCVGG